MTDKNAEHEIQHRRNLWKILNYTGGDAVEVGVAEGNFSRDMLNWPVHFPRVYMVDRWAQNVHLKGDSAHPNAWHVMNLKSATEKVKPFGERAVILRGESGDMAKQVPDGSLALVYIDADHSFIGVTNDIHAWLPKLKHGGVMAFHDFEMEAYGVKKAVTLFCEAHNIAVHLIPEDKKEDAGAWFRNQFE